MNRTIWIGAGAVLLAGALWLGFRGGEQAGDDHLAPVEGGSAALSGKVRQDGGSEGLGERPGRAGGPAKPEPMSAAERLVLEGKASPAMVAAVAKAGALVPRFKQVLQLPTEKANDVTIDLMEEVSELPVISDDLANSMRDVLLTASPATIDYATSALEEQGTPAGAGLLADLLRHPNEDVRDSALTALEGMAGDVFETPEQAENWARNWKLSPQEMTELLGEVATSANGAIPGVPVPNPASEDILPEVGP